MGIYRVSIDRARFEIEGGRRLRIVSGRRHPLPWHDVHANRLILSKSAALEHKSDATRLRRSLAPAASCRMFRTALVTGSSCTFSPCGPNPGRRSCRDGRHALPVRARRAAPPPVVGRMTRPKRLLGWLRAHHPWSAKSVCASLSTLARFGHRQLPPDPRLARRCRPCLTVALTGRPGVKAAVWDDIKAVVTRPSHSKLARAVSQRPGHR